MMNNTPEDATEELIQQEQPEESKEVVEEAKEPAAEEAPRKRSESWFSKFGKSVAGAAKKVGESAKKLGKNIGDNTKKVFAKKPQSGDAPSSGETEEAEVAAEPAAAPDAAGAAEPKQQKSRKFPAVGQRCTTPYGDGQIMLLEEGRAVVHLDWHLADGMPVRAYIGVEQLKRCVPKILRDANKAFLKVGDAIADGIAGDNGLFGRNTWNKVGAGLKKAGGAIKNTADKAFKKKKPQGGQLEEQLVEESAPDEAAPAEEGQGEAGTEEEEVQNPYAAPTATEE